MIDCKEKTQLRNSHKSKQHWDVMATWLFRQDSAWNMSYSHLLNQTVTWLQPPLLNWFYDIALSSISFILYFLSMLLINAGTKIILTLLSFNNLTLAQTCKPCMLLGCYRQNQRKIIYEYRRIMHHGKVHWNRPSLKANCPILAFPLLHFSCLLKRFLLCQVQSRGHEKQPFVFGFRFLWRQQFIPPTFSRKCQEPPTTTACALKSQTLISPVPHISSWKKISTFSWEELGWFPFKPDIIRCLRIQYEGYKSNYM